MTDSSSESEKRKPNRLIDETSPYLLQHAYNPVEWFPWNEDALKRARELDRPIFLSIGYSACHWCHVMEHESFEDSGIAELMNEHYVCIKVDREERPDLDQIYMNSVQLMTRSGGWPMSVFMTPDLKPFFGGTYWPPESRMGMPGFRDILQKVNEAWSERRADVIKGADELTQAVIESVVPHSQRSNLDESILQNAMRDLLRAADRTHGGFGGAPKFPHPMDIRVLLRAWKRFGNEDALAVARLALDKMALGGIYDHLGGGFHRYATDARWLVPHFEKMLYDNALLTMAYLEAFQATGESDYARVVRETLDYVLREMTQPEGGFYSTQDADSEGVEGKFFVWTEEEVLQVLGGDDEKHFSYCYDVTSQGNWEGNNILNRVKPHAAAAAMLQVDENELSEVLSRCREQLFEVRSSRIAPGRDDKVLASWNGLMIAAMAQAAQVLGEQKYATAAKQAADFVLETMRTDGGHLLHSYKDGRSRFNAYLDDYACMIDGLVEVYQSTSHADYLCSALELANVMIEQFHDTDGGGFFYTSSDHEELIARNKDSQDNATPSGNGMAATSLLRVGRLCSRPDLEAKAVETLEVLSGQMARIAMASGQALIALDFVLGPTREIVVVGPDTKAAIRLVQGHFLPNKVVASVSTDTRDDELPEPIKLLISGKTASDNQTTTYVCEHGTCGDPVVGIDNLRDALEAM